MIRVFLASFTIVALLLFVPWVVIIVGSFALWRLLR